MALTPAFGLRTAAVVVCVACACFLWPAAAAGAWMKGPGPGASWLPISRAAFEANPQRYFKQLRCSGRLRCSIGRERAFCFALLKSVAVFGCGSSSSTHCVCSYIQ